MNTNGKHYKLVEIGEQYPNDEFLYNLIKTETNTFHFLIAQMSRNILSFCLTNKEHCCEFYNAYGELIFDYFQPIKNLKVTNNNMNIYQIKLQNVILVMLQKGTKEQIVFYSHVFYFPMYITKTTDSTLENFRFQIYKTLNTLGRSPTYSLLFKPINFVNESNLQQTLENIQIISKKITVSKNLNLDKISTDVMNALNASDEDNISAPSSLQYSTTESQPINLELDLFNKPLTDHFLSHALFNNAFSLIESSATTKILSESSTEMKRYINLPEGSLSKELLGSLTKSFNLQITSGGDLIDSNNNALDVDTLQNMLVSYNGPNSEIVNAIVTASKLGSDSFLSTHFSEIPVQEMYLKGFEITTRFNQNNNYFTDLQLQYSDSDSLTASVSKLKTYIEHVLLPYDNVKTMKKSIQDFGTILLNVQVDEDTKALILPHVGRLINDLSLHNNRLEIVSTNLESAAKKFGTDQVMTELSRQTLLPLQSIGELLLNGLTTIGTEQKGLNGLTTIGTEQKGILLKLLNSENNLSTYSNEEKFSYLMMYLNEQIDLSKQVEEDLYPLMDLFNKDYESIQLNGEVISTNDKTNLFKKEYLQASHTFKLLSKNYVFSPPRVKFENLLSDGIIQHLPPPINFNKLLSDGIVQYLPGQLPIKTTTINNNQVKSRASEFLYRPTSKFSSSQPNTPSTDLLERLRKLRVQKEQQAERLRQEEAEAQQQRKQAEAEAEAERQRKQEEAERQREQEDAEIERSVLRNLIRSFWIVFSIMVFTVLIGIILYRYYFDYFNNFSFVRLITRWRSN